MAEAGSGDPYTLVRVSGPAVEPVSLTEAETHCRIDLATTDEDGLLLDCIQAAREYCEEHLGQAFVSQTWKMYLDCFPSWEIRVPRPPLSSVTHVKYRDSDGVLQTLSSSLYDVDVASRPGRITPAYNEVWPTARYHTNAVEIQFVAGEGAAASAVPARVKQAMKLLIGHWYENREAVVTGTISTELQKTVDALLSTAWAGTY